MLNSDVYWITCEMDVTCDLLCWITTILACMLVGMKSLVISLDYRSYMGSSVRIWSLRWLFLYWCSYNLDGSVTTSSLTMHLSRVFSPSKPLSPWVRSCCQSSLASLTTSVLTTSISSLWTLKEHTTPSWLTSSGHVYGDTALCLYS
jgi:hypothetical protein